MAGVDPHAIVAEDLPGLLLPYADGLITIDRVRRAPDSAVCPVPAGDPRVGELVTWVDFITADPAQAARTATTLVRSADLTAVSVHARYVPAETAALAVCFAGRLHDARAARALASRVIVADHRPELAGPAPGGAVNGARSAATGSAGVPPGPGLPEGLTPGGVKRGPPYLVRVPHIVAVWPPPGESCGPRGGPNVPRGVTGRVVWEIMNTDQYRAWVGRPPGPLDGELERHLGGLLTLAALVRARCAQVPHREEVLQALGGGPFTIEAAHRHPALFLAVAAALGDREA